ncbi:agmatinase [Pseudoduganella aquatica]|uniref:agmatinase n=1 Tax=Pseudoduganella aquatica TaxID=2660641 RepID=UPI001E3320F3|nr:agmatinase [Pseudoduganella aquatica]
MSSHDFAYLSQATFLHCPQLGYAPAMPFGIAGIPYDGAVTNRPGARFGPQAIRSASRMLCDAIHPHFDTSPLGWLADAGDLALPNTSLGEMRAALMPHLHEMVQSRHMVWLGGDHSVTLPILRALRERHGVPLAVLHFDAHCDTWTSHFGEPSGHGTWMAEAIQENLVRADATVQIGIRSAGERSARAYVADQGGRVWTARELRGLDNTARLAPLLDDVRARMARAGNPPAYLTLDIDCLDPAFAPGTGTPEAGGLSTSQVMTIIEELAGLNWVGMDCVEVAPAYDHAELTSIAAATLIHTYLCGQIHRRQSA